MELFYNQYQINYGDEDEARRLGLNDMVVNQYFLDYVEFVGRVMTPLAPNGPQDVLKVYTMSFQSWSKPYGGNLAQQLQFSLHHRTLHIGTGPGREQWFVVMHPRSQAGLSAESPTRQQLRSGAKRSALEARHARVLLAYVQEIFRTNDSLVDRGLLPTWQLGKNESCTLHTREWRYFQECFVTAWQDLVLQHSQDTFWTDNLPAFHCYDYGSNVSIEPDEDYAFVSKLDSFCDVEALLLASFAPAVNIHHQSELDGVPQVFSLLGDRNEILKEYGWDETGVDFYPLGFNPQYVNFQASRPPDFLENGICGPLQQMMSEENECQHVLQAEKFQGYSTIKSTIRHHPDDLTVTKGWTSAAITLREEVSSQRERRKQRQLLALSQGRSPTTDVEQQSNHGLIYSKPLAWERNRIIDSIENSLVGYRMEQIFVVHVSRLLPSQRSITQIFRPLREYISYFESYPSEYISLLHRFLPDSFPGILVEFSYLFEAAFDDLVSRWTRKGRDDLSIAICEGVSIFERMSNCCFTGDARVLSSVVKRLQIGLPNEGPAIQAWHTFLLSQYITEEQLERQPQHLSGYESLVDNLLSAYMWQQKISGQY
ncbi:hypothetical protein L228DRAFT_264294 [Xylona heveae TC161]|uniref:Uncharacterized protein n=1 Tax=Xylona heveae (strain CBS 132557 / TC161) TaxID=1328760 RepID=A0A164Z7J4_XYLHT|nr:hypothetical protein L228DRAFT_264294 [Xylona heveae TC161]KZF18785.1 hypothetical protein L228DRAFT_264294 [Xylona heveae TC161]